MAYAITPIPGGEFLCGDDCHHTDCKANRETIAAVCRYCNEPIGPDRRYNHESSQPQDAFVHWGCLHEHYANEHPFGQPSNCELAHE